MPNSTAQSIPILENHVAPDAPNCNRLSLPSPQGSSLQESLIGKRGLRKLAGSRTISLRSVSEAIRRSALDDGVGTRVAESLLILGLEGSPHGVHTLWRFNLGLRSIEVIGGCNGALPGGRSAAEPRHDNERFDDSRSVHTSAVVRLHATDRDVRGCRGSCSFRTRIGGERSRTCAAVSRSRITIGPAQ